MVIIYGKPGVDCYHGSTMIRNILEYHNADPNKLPRRSDAFPIASNFCIQVSNHRPEEVPEDDPEPIHHLPERDSFRSWTQYNVHDPAGAPNRVCHEEWNLGVSNCQPFLSKYCRKDLSRSNLG